MPKPPTKQDMANAVKALAEKRYNKSHGFQVFVECYSDDELLEFVKDCKSIREALSLARTIAGIRDEQMAGAQAEVF